jgi:hypothetical protein
MVPTALLPVLWLSATRFFFCAVSVPLVPADAVLAQVNKLLPLSTLASLVIPDNITIVVPGGWVAGWMGVARMLSSM